MDKINATLKFYNIPLEMSSPKTKDGVKKPLGIWEFDGHYELFKTIGAKRYLLKYSNDERNKQSKRGKYLLTVAGLSKKIALEYILKQKNPFDFFRVHMYIPENYTGKLTHTYIDEIRRDIVTDYNGLAKPVISLSSVHLSKQDYSVSIAKDYADFLKGKHDVFAR